MEPAKRYRGSNPHEAAKPPTKTEAQGVPSRVPPPPGPLDDRAAALDARIRLKLDRGEPLDEEERRFLAELPADSAISPDDIR